MLYEDLPDYYDYDYTRDWGWDTAAPRIKVPGFGFVPAELDKELNAMTQVREIMSMEEAYSDAATCIRVIHHSPVHQLVPNIREKGAFNF